MSQDTDNDITAPKAIPPWRLVLSHARITQAVVTHQYSSDSTTDNPYIVAWVESDPGNPMEFSSFRK
jgi:hypothetical protein